MNDIETVRANLDHSESCNIARSKEASRFWNTKMADLPCLPDCPHAALSRIEARIAELEAVALAASRYIRHLRDANLSAAVDDYRAWQDAFARAALAQSPQEEDPRD